MSSGSIILSWNEAKDKKVKSSDDKDLGKVQNVTRDYIEIKEGLISKKTYFIPKYYVQGYDGNSIWISLRKEDAKQRFEKESPPRDMSEFETPDYVQRIESVKKQYPDFDDDYSEIYPNTRNIFSKYHCPCISIYKNGKCILGKTFGQKSKIKRQ